MPSGQCGESLLFIHSNIVFSFQPLATCRPWSRVSHSRWVVSGFTWWTGAAEESAAEHEEGSARPADVQGGPELPALGIREHRVVEVPDDGVGRPGDWNELHDSRYNEQDTRDDHHPGFGGFFFDAVGALGPGDGNQHGQESQQDGDDGEGPGCLEILGKSQHGVVDLALHLTSALNHAGHPQALPDDLSRYNVAANEGRHPPHGQSTCYNGYNPSQNAYAHAYQLQSCRHVETSFWSSAAAEMCVGPLRSALRKKRSAEGKSRPGGGPTGN